jgi:hypothetical protein
MRLPACYLSTLRALCGPAPAPDALLAQEASPFVARAPLLRVLARLPPGEGWLLRYAVSCAIASAVDASSRRCSLAAAHAALGPRLGDPEALALRTGPLAGGLLWRTPDDSVLCGPVVDAWLIGEEVPPAWAAPVDLPDWLLAAEALDAPARRLAVALDGAPEVVLRCDDEVLAAALADAVARARGRRAVAWRIEVSDDRERDVRPLLAWAAALEDRDLILTRREDRRFREPIGPSRTRVPVPGARAWQVVGTSAFDRVEWPAGVAVLDLEPLRGDAGVRAAVARSGASADPLDLAAADRLVRAAPLHRALYDAPPPTLSLGAPARPAERRGDDEFDRPAAVYEAAEASLAELVCDDRVRAALAGAAERARRGERCVLVLHGPPGAGKSFAARCLAGAAGLPVVRLEASAVRSRWVGGEETRLRSLFGALAATPAVLLIDEADDWLGRREGSSATVGGARIASCSELLRHLERFRGVAVLTSNRPEVFDPALHRRVDAWIPLDLPDGVQRLVLWGLALAEREDLAPSDLAVLAAWPLSGGDIRAACAEAALSGARPTAKALCAAARRRAEQRRLVA